MCFTAHVIIVTFIHIPLPTKHLLFNTLLFASCASHSALYLHYILIHPLQSLISHTHSLPPSLPTPHIIRHTFFLFCTLHHSLWSAYSTIFYVPLHWDTFCYHSLLISIHITPFFSLSLSITPTLLSATSQLNHSRISAIHCRHIFTLFSLHFPHITFKI